MPDALLYYAIFTVGVGIVTEVVAAVLLLVVALRGVAAGARRIAGHQPDDSSVLTPCGSPDCRDLRTVHHVTASGLRCAECGHYADAG